MMFTVEAAVSGAGYLTLALSVGVLLTAAFLLTGSEDVAMRGRLAAAVPVLFCALLVIGLLIVVVQGAKLSGGNFPSLDILIRYLSRTQSGRIWLAREIYLLLLLIIGVWLLRPQAELGKLRLLFFLFLPLVASRGLTGHAVAVRENTTFMLAADAVHMIAVTFWAGGLPVLFWVLWKNTREANHSPARAARVVQRFSRVAFISVCLLVPSGLYQSLTHVQDLQTLLNTSYGNMLSLKLLLFGVMLALGALNRFFAKPALARLAASDSHAPTNTKIFYRIGWEGVLGIAVLIATGFLTTLPPGVHSAHNLANPRSGFSGSSAVHSHPPVNQIEPAEGAAVKILSPGEGQTFSGDQIPLNFSLTRGRRGHHVHVYVDNELMGMFESEKGTLNGIKPGSHVLKLRVVAEDHQTELDASDEVHFVIK